MKSLRVDVNPMPGCATLARAKNAGPVLNTPMFGQFV